MTITLTSGQPTRITARTPSPVKATTATAPSRYAAARSIRHLDDADPSASSPLPATSAAAATSRPTTMASRRTVSEAKGRSAR